MTGFISNGTTVTSRTGTFRVIDCPCGQVDEDGDASGALVLVECIAGDAPRHVPGRRVMMPAEQLRRAA
jgi:hypothetical protein